MLLKDELLSDVTEYRNVLLNITTTFKENDLGKKWKVWAPSPVLDQIV